VDHECDRQTDGQTEPPLATAQSTDRRYIETGEVEKCQMLPMYNESALR